MSVRMKLSSRSSGYLTMTSHEIASSLSEAQSGDHVVCEFMIDIYGDDPFDRSIGVVFY